MFQSKNKKIMDTPVNPSFTIYKWGVRGSSLHGHVFMMISFNYHQVHVYTFSVLLNHGLNLQLHTSDLKDGYDWGRLNLQSVTEQNNLEEFLSTAEMAGTEFTAGTVPFCNLLQTGPLKSVR